MEQIITMTGDLCRSKKNVRPKPAGPDRNRCRRGDRFTLRLAREGEWVEIVSLSGGRGCQDRLTGMGLRIGTQVQVLCNDMDKKLLLSHRGARFYLGGGMARKIQVASIEEESK